MADLNDGDWMRLLMLLYKCWHARNEITHHKLALPAEASKCFLQSYVSSLLFWEGLEDMVRSVSIGEKLFIGGDLNGHVGTSNTGFEGVHGGFGYSSRNQGECLDLCFSLQHDRS